MNKNSVILLMVATVQGIFNDVDYGFWQSCTDLYLLKVINNSSGLRTFAPKSSHAQIIFKLATQKDYDILLPKRQKKLGVTDFVLERTCLEKYPKSEKSGFVS